MLANHFAETCTNGIPPSPLYRLHLQRSKLGLQIIQGLQKLQLKLLKFSHPYVHHFTGLRQQLDPFFR